MDDVLRLVSPEAIITSSLMGVIVGYATVRGIDAWSVFAGIVRVGVPFFAVMMMLRYAEGTEIWEAWIGGIFLFVCYAAGTAIGFRFRRYRGGTVL